MSAQKQAQSFRNFVVEPLEWAAPEKPEDSKRDIEAEGTAPDADK